MKLKNLYSRSCLIIVFENDGRTHLAGDPCGPHPPGPAIPNNCLNVQLGSGKGGEKTGGRRHWVGDFTFIPFSNTASLTLSLTLGPGWTDRRGRAAIDLPVIMGVTQEATWPPSSLLAALQPCIGQRITLAPQQRLVR